MKKFIKNLSYFLSPFLMVLVIVIYLDVFKIFGFQEDYYENNFIELPRGLICTKTYQHYSDSLHFNSFIFGSSRSNAYKLVKWSKYLKKDTSPFHFDGNGEGIYDINSKVKYIDEQGDSIKNALIILDRTVLKNTEIRKGHLYIPHPTLSKESYSEFYLTFLKAMIDPKFNLAYADYHIFKKYRNYMEGLINPFKFPDSATTVNCDLWYGFYKHIKVDSIGYYNNLIKKGVFYERPIERDWECKVTNLEINQLNEIKDIFVRHKTKYKIIISPVYDQIPMEQEQLNLLNKIFGQENIYNFSGKNKFTEPISNFYEDNHYRPHVADEIMEIVYQ